MKNNIKLKSIKYIIIVSTLISYYTINYYTSSKKLFNDYNVKLIGTNYLEPEIIKNYLYPDLTNSLVAINSYKIKQKLKSINYISSVQLSKIMPGTLLINIIERDPIILIMGEKNLFMDIDGNLLPVDDKSLKIFSTPIINIIDENFDLNNNISKIRAFFDFLINNHLNYYKQLKEIRIYSDEWIFHDINNTKIFAKNNNLDIQINILRKFETTISPLKKLKDYSYIDLRIDNQIIVKEKFQKG